MTCYVNRRRFLSLCSSALPGLCGCLGTDENRRSTIACGENTPTSSVDISSISGDWPTYQYDERNSGYSPGATSTRNCPSIQWRYREIEHWIVSAPVVSGSTVFVSGDREHLYAVDATTGEERWRYRARSTSGGFGTTPTVADGIVYVTFGDTAQAIDIETRREIWYKSYDEQLDAPLTVVDGVVYAGGQNGLLAALDVETGREQWTFRAPRPHPNEERSGENIGEFHRPPAIEDGTVYAGSRNGILYAFDVDSGDMLWNQKLDDQIMNAPVFHDGSIHLVTSRSVYSVDASNGSVRFKQGDGAVPRGAIAVAGETLFAAWGTSMGNVKLHAFDTTDGTIRWSVPTGNPCSITVAGDTVLAGVGDLVGHDRETGNERWRLEASSIGRPIAVIDGVVFAVDEVVGDSSFLYAIA